MTSCWKAVAQRKLGLFSRDFDLFDCPISAGQCVKQRPTPCVAPHNIWINFLAERVSLARYLGQEQLDLLEMMFTQTCSTTVGDSCSASMLSSSCLNFPLVPGHERKGENTRNYEDN